MLMQSEAESQNERKPIPFFSLIVTFRLSSFPSHACHVHHSKVSASSIQFFPSDVTRRLLKMATFDVLSRKYTIDAPSPPGSLL